MPELRKDPIVDRWVVMAPERAQRPIDVRDNISTVPEAFDPFAEGNESSTTPEVAAIRHSDSLANQPGWTVRVVPNKFPAVLEYSDPKRQIDGLYESMDGVGIHEVIVECPHFETNMSRLSLDNIQDVLRVYRDRLIDIRQDRRIAHALIFKNKGILAGASLQHSHSQLIATAVVPVSISDELRRCSAYYDQNGRSLFDDLIAQELRDESRIVLQTADFVALCPYASRFAYETWILPKQPASHFENITETSVEGLGTVLKAVLQKQELVLDDPPYNFVIHSAPFDPSDLACFRWHIELFPRLTRVAGYEWGSGFYINEVLPEVAAAVLRAAVIA